MYKKYGPLEVDYAIDITTKSNYMHEWYWKVMDLIYQYDLTYDKLLACVNCADIVFRSGVKNFLRNLYNLHVPIIILSAGIGNVIVEVLKQNECLYDNIHVISNFLKFEDNHMLPFQDKMIYTFNKCINQLPTTISTKIMHKDYILLFGDLIEDLNMVSKEDLDRTLSFGFLEKNVKDNLEFYRSSFDIVLTNNSSFDDVQNILNEIKKD